jgi:lysozyme
MALGFVHVDLASALTTVNGAKVKLTANQTAALEDFVYNLGAGNFNKSNVLRLIRAGDYAGAARRLTDWDCAGGHILAGLGSRAKLRLKQNSKSIQN